MRGSSPSRTWVTEESRIKVKTTPLAPTMVVRRSTMFAMLAARALARMIPTNLGEPYFSSSSGPKSRM